MDKLIQLGYIVTMMISMSAFSVQMLSRAKNLPVTEQMVKHRVTTIFLLVIAMFNVCDFLILFMEDWLGAQSISWIYVVENLLEITLAYALIEMERVYLGVEKSRGLSALFFVIGGIVLWMDTAYTAGVIITTEHVYMAVMTGLNLFPVGAVLQFSLRYRKKMKTLSAYTGIRGYFFLYNLLFMFLCIVATISMIDSRTTVDYVLNDKAFYVIFWLLFDVMNVLFICRACQPMDEAQCQPTESAEEKLNRLAGEFGFSAREREIAQRLCRGQNNNDIAAALFLSPNTIKVHTSNVYRKLGVKNRVQAVQMLNGCLLAGEE